MQADISILVLGYNSAKYLTSCLGSVDRAISRYSFEILFLNNGSDDSEELVSERFPDVQVLPSLGNIGFAQGNNHLARHAKAGRLLLLNPDTELFPDAIDLLLDTANAHREFEVFGGVTATKTGEEQAHATCRLLTLAAVCKGAIGRASEPKILDKSAEIVEVEMVSGGFLLVTQGLWKKLGGFDESFFLYGEDMDLCKRMADLGRRMALVPASKLFHDVGSGDPYSLRRIMLQATGNAHYFSKHFSRPYAALCVAVLWINFVSRFVAGRVLSPFVERYAALSAGHAQVALKPWKWMGGFSAAGADPRRKSG